MRRPDGAGWVLAAAVWLLPPQLHEWGTAMRAELAGIDEGRERWRFTLGCVRVVATRPAVWRPVGYCLLSLAAMAGAVRGTARVWYTPLRAELIGMIAILVLVAWWGRMRPFGPVGDGRTARGARAFGYLMVGVWAAKIVADMAGHVGNPDSQVPEAPVMAAVCLVYLVGLQAVTARRSQATGRVLVAGLGAGVAAAAAWTVMVVLAPPIPDDLTPAVEVVVIGMAVAAAAAGGGDDPLGRLLAAGCAGTTGALLTVDVVAVSTAFGPPRLIPDLAPAALSRADDLAQSRIELLEPYLLLLLFGALIALALGVASLATRGPATATTRPGAGGDPAAPGVSGGGPTSPWPHPEGTASPRP